MTAIPVNHRQQRILDLLIDGPRGGLSQGRLTVTRWTRICCCSHEVAKADIAQLAAHGLLAPDRLPDSQPAWALALALVPNPNPELTG